MRTAVRSAAGQYSTGPSGVVVQSMDRMSAPSSPPPARHEAASADLRVAAAPAVVSKISTALLKQFNNLMRLFFPKTHVLLQLFPMFANSTLMSDVDRYLVEDADQGGGDHQP